METDTSTKKKTKNKKHQLSFAFAAPPHIAMKPPANNMDLVFSLCVAARDGDDMGIIELIHKGGNINLPTQDDLGKTYPLLLSTINGHIKCVALLLSRGADVNVSDDKGYTALTYACELRNKPLVNLLLLRKADINAKDNNGNTALLFTSQNDGNVSMVQFLLAKGANINHVNCLGASALFLAAAHNRLEVAEVLVEAEGCDINRRDNNGGSPLLISSLNGKFVW